MFFTSHFPLEMSAGIQSRQTQLPSTEAFKCVSRREMRAVEVKVSLIFFFPKLMLHDLSVGAFPKLRGAQKSPCLINRAKQLVRAL